MQRRVGVAVAGTQDADPAGARQYGGRLDEPTAVAEVFDDPPFVERVGAGFVREGDEVGLGDVSGEEDADRAGGLLRTHERSSW
jgi:hypothetical protein